MSRTAGLRLRGQGQNRAVVQLAVAPPATPRALALASTPSFLCTDEAARRRLLEMERELMPVRAALFGALAVALIAMGPYSAGGRCSRLRLPAWAFGWPT